MSIKWNIGRTDARREDELRRQMVALLPRLRRFASTLTGEPDQGDELVQMACERALKRLRQFRDGSRLDSWLYRIINTQWVDRLRRRKTREAHAKAKRNARQQNVVENLPSRRIDTMMDVRRALAALTDEHRVAVSLVVIEGYTYAEAATILETPTGTVASRVARARRELIGQLRPERRGSLFKVHVGAGGKDVGHE